MPQGRFTGISYNRMPKASMLPVQDITALATGMPEQQAVVPMQALPASPIDPAYDAWMRGEDSRGTYAAPGLLDVDSNFRAEQMDRGLPLFNE